MRFSTMVKSVILLALWSASIFAQTNQAEKSEPLFIYNPDNTLNTTNVSAWGMAAIDYDSDGLLDICGITLNGTDRLFHNEGNGTFKLIDTDQGGFEGGSSDCGLSWGDLDNDGDPDVAIGTQSGKNHIFRNNGTNGFARISKGIAVTDRLGSYDAVWVDYDNDGWLDLYTANIGTLETIARPGTPNYLFHNNGNGTFTKIENSVISTESKNNITGTWADFDNDGDQDLFSPEVVLNNSYYLNNGDGTFTQVTEGDIVEGDHHSFCGSVSDYDNDGDLDLFVASTNSDKNEELYDLLLNNNGDGSFKKVTEDPVVTTISNAWNGAWGDYDNDGDEDLFVSCWGSDHLLYSNNGDGTFIQVTDEAMLTELNGKNMATALWGDFDNDGDLDFIGANCLDNRIDYFENRGNSNHWLKIKLQGTVSNRSAIGARVKIKAKIDGKNVWQIREISASNGFRSMNEGLRAHFGIGEAEVIDSLIINWPSGQQTIKTNIQADQFLNIEEENTIGEIRSGFYSDILSGFAEVKVKFYDQSYSDVSAPITTWEWDFDEDGIIDSYEQNPEFTFSSQETKKFDVKLTTSNGLKNAELLCEGFISLTGYISVINLNTSTFELDTVQTSFDTTFTVYNSGPAADSIEISTTSAKGKYTFEPTHFVIAGFDSQVVKLHLNTGELNPNNYFDFFKLKAFNSNKNINFYIKFSVDNSTDIKETSLLNDTFSLAQNYPNPFNPSTNIVFNLPTQGFVKLTIVDLLGKKVDEPIANYLGAGMHSIEYDASRLSSGIYIYQLSYQDKIERKKMILLK